MKLLVYIILVYLIYRTLRAWLRPTPRQKVHKSDAPPLTADDVMIQDPQCGIYFARRDGISLSHEGQTLYFCSEACKEKFLAKQ